MAAVSVVSMGAQTAVEMAVSRAVSRVAWMGLTDSKKVETTASTDKKMVVTTASTDKKKAYY